jgi:hypothetical protein
MHVEKHDIYLDRLAAQVSVFPAARRLKMLQQDPRKDPTPALAVHPHHD